MTGTIYMDNKKMMDVALSRMERWMKKMMKQVIAVVKKKIELIEKINNMYFAFMTIQIDGKI